MRLLVGVKLKLLLREGYMELSRLHKIIIDARRLEKEAHACPFNLDGLREHYKLNLPDAQYVKDYLDRDKEYG